MGEIQYSVDTLLNALLCDFHCGDILSPHPSLVSIFTCVSYKSLQYHTYAEEYLGYPCACCKQTGKVHMVHDSGLH